MLHKGRVGFKQYIPNKRARFGIKMFSLCDEQGYLWNSEVYTGKSDTTSDTSSHDLGKSGEVVVRLIRPLLNKGYHLYIDNYYTSPNLLEYLFDNKTLACGTLRKNRGKFPLDFMSMKLNRGDVLYLSKGK